MSRIFLLRHAHSVANARGILAGRIPQMPLSQIGVEQRVRLEQRLAGAKFDQIISSPIQRCIETVQIFNGQLEVIDDFQEVDYGDWSGRKLSSLMRNKAWQEVYKSPASIRFPNGETLPEVQTRAIKGLDLYLKPKAKNILISTHSDVVKVLVLHALGTHLNSIDKLQINNASISIIERDKSGLRVLRVNDDTSSIAELLK